VNYGESSINVGICVYYCYVSIIIVNINQHVHRQILDVQLQLFNSDLGILYMYLFVQAGDV